MDLVARILGLFDGRGKLKLAGLACLMAVGALLELVGLGLVMPVVAMLAEPSLLAQNKYLHAIHSALGSVSDSHFLLLLCFLVAFAYLFKNAFLLFLTKMQADFMYSKSLDIGSRLFRNYLYAPYSYHLRTNSSRVINNLNMMSVMTNGVLMGLMMICSEFVVVVAIAGTMFFFAPLLSLCLLLVSIGAGALLYFPLKRRSCRIGERLKLANRAATGDAMQTMECLKELKVRNCEDFLVARNALCQARLRSAEGDAYVSGQIPRFAIEAFIVMAGMGALAALILLDVATGSIVLRLSFIAVAMIRLMPSFSRVNYQLTTVRHLLPLFREMMDDLEKLKPSPSREAAEPLKFEREIRIENVSFRYEGAPVDVLSGVSLEIPRNSSVAFVGRTGCGKTTLLDILLGLLKPASGRISVDGRDIEENLPSWQKRIGYVPQTIHLFDDSIRANVAFCVPPAKIDDAKIRDCLETAQLREFVETLPEGVETVVGERGVRLSGGQRQRIGIARALYHDPEILALDEATSALDDDTEKAFVDALKNLKGKLTIMMIAHRLTTVANCDKIVRLDASEVL